MKKIINSGIVVVASAVALSSVVMLKNYELQNRANKAYSDASPLAASRSAAEILDTMESSQNAFIAGVADAYEESHGQAVTLFFLDKEGDIQSFPSYYKAGKEIQAQQDFSAEQIQTAHADLRTTMGDIREAGWNLEKFVTLNPNVTGTDAQRAYAASGVVSANITLAFADAAGTGHHFNPAYIDRLQEMSHTGNADIDLTVKTYRDAIIGVLKEFTSGNEQAVSYAVNRVNETPAEAWNSVRSAKVDYPQEPARSDASRSSVNPVLLSAVKIRKDMDVLNVVSDATKDVTVFEASPDN